MYTDKPLAMELKKKLSCEIKGGKKSRVDDLAMVEQGGEQEEKREFGEERVTAQEF